MERERETSIHINIYIYPGSSIFQKKDQDIMGISWKTSSHIYIYTYIYINIHKYIDDISDNQDLFPIQVSVLSSVPGIHAIHAFRASVPTLLAFLFVGGTPGLRSKFTKFTGWWMGWWMG